MAVISTTPNPFINTDCILSQPWELPIPDQAIPSTHAKYWEKISTGQITIERAAEVKDIYETVILQTKIINKELRELFRKPEYDTNDAIVLGGYIESIEHINYIIGIIMQMSPESLPPDWFFTTACAQAEYSLNYCKLAYLIVVSNKTAIEDIKDLVNEGFRLINTAALNLNKFAFTEVNSEPAKQLRKYNYYLYHGKLSLMLAYCIKSADFLQNQNNFKSLCKAYFLFLKYLKEFSEDASISFTEIKAKMQKEVKQTLPAEYETVFNYSPNPTVTTADITRYSSPECLQEIQAIQKKRVDKRDHNQWQALTCFIRVKIAQKNQETSDAADIARMISAIYKDDDVKYLCTKADSSLQPNIKIDILLEYANLLILGITAKNQDPQEKQQYLTKAEKIASHISQLVEQYCSWQQLTEQQYKDYSQLIRNISDVVIKEQIKAHHLSEMRKASSKKKTTETKVTTDVIKVTRPLPKKDTPENIHHKIVKLITENANTESDVMKIFGTGKIAYKINDIDKIKYFIEVSLKNSHKIQVLEKDAQESAPKLLNSVFIARFLISYQLINIILRYYFIAVCVNKAPDNLNDILLESLTWFKENFKQLNNISKKTFSEIAKCPPEEFKQKYYCSLVENIHLLVAPGHKIDNPEKLGILKNLWLLLKDDPTSARGVLQYIWKNKKHITSAPLKEFIEFVVSLDTQRKLSDLTDDYKRTILASAQSAIQTPVEHKKSPAAVQKPSVQKTGKTKTGHGFLYSTKPKRKAAEDSTKPQEATISPEITTKKASEEIMSQQPVETQAVAEPQSVYSEIPEPAAQQSDSTESQPQDPTSQPTSSETQAPTEQQPNNTVSQVQDSVPLSVPKVISLIPDIAEEALQKQQNTVPLLSSPIIPILSEEKPRPPVNIATLIKHNIFDTQKINYVQTFMPVLVPAMMQVTHTIDLVSIPEYAIFDCITPFVMSDIFANCSSLEQIQNALLNPELDDKISKIIIIPNLMDKIRTNPSLFTWLSYQIEYLRSRHPDSAKFCGNLFIVAATVIRAQELREIKGLTLDFRSTLLHEKITVAPLPKNSTYMDLLESYYNSYNHMCLNMGSTIQQITFPMQSAIP